MTNASGFLLTGTLVVLRSKTSPRAEMLGGRKHGHIHTDLGNDSDGEKGLDTRHRIKVRSSILRTFVSAKMKFCAGIPGEWGCQAPRGCLTAYSGGVVKGAATAAFIGMTGYGHADP